MVRRDNMAFDIVSFIMGQQSASGGGGGGGGADTIYVIATGHAMPNENYLQRWFMYNNSLYAVANQNNMNSVVDFYKYENDAWTKIVSSFNLGLARMYTSHQFVEYNGKIHISYSGAGGMIKHAVFDGTTVTLLNDYPATQHWIAVYKEKLIAAVSGYVYEWDEETDTWNQVMANDSIKADYLVVIGDNLYQYEWNRLNKIDISAGTYENIFTTSKLLNIIYQSGSNIYGYHNGDMLYKYDIENNVESYVGRILPAQIYQSYDGKLKSINGVLGNYNLSEAEYFLP